jgi:hypothetical protein
LKLLVLALLVLQLGPRPLSSSETLVKTDTLQAIFGEPGWETGVRVVNGSDARTGEILLTCLPNECALALQAIMRLQGVVSRKKVPQPSRTIRVVSSMADVAPERVKATIHVAVSDRGGWQILRGLWSTAGIGDEVMEIFANGLGAQTLAYESRGQLPLDPFGVSTTTIVTSGSVTPQQSFVVAAAAYFLATLPNAGTEALLSHLTVGAHARLAEDGRRAVSMMGNQQRAGAEVLIMFGQAIEREQRRMRSTERFMPTPVDPMLRSRLSDMEKAITAIWTSIGITSSPFVPAAERIRGRGGVDNRIPSRNKPGALPVINPPTAFVGLNTSADVAYELGNFIDGKRSISDIRDALSAEFGSLPLPSVTDYFERLAKQGAITIK